MPRPIKEGLDYFPLDVNLDDKIYMVECELGLTGFALLIKLFIKIYKNGYYINWTGKTAKMFSRQNNTEIDVVNKLIDVCINEEIIDKYLYKKYNVLTSRGIQKRYLEAVKRRKEIVLIKKYMLVEIVEKSINVNIRWIDVNNNSINDNDNKQSKVKKSKVKKSIKEVQNQPFKTLIKEGKKKKPANNIEFDFELWSWHGIDDDIKDRWARIFPNVDVEIELNKIRVYFKKHPKYEKIIEGKFNNNYAIYIFDWLARAEGYAKEKKDELK
ncbi:MAG: DUF4373 domain-containing protein [Candidatus Marinimicrobia bacterium]|nr:DUF4373 domain-containing protein [Candidatus Neomarinimicrobiota bacterium]